MYLCARVSPCSGQTGAHAAGSAGFHGHDIIVRAISPLGFEADARVFLAPGEIVRLRLPGAGNVIARVTEAADGALRGEFVNGLAPQRLRMALGMSAATA